MALSPISFGIPSDSHHQMFDELSYGYGPCRLEGAQNSGTKSVLRHAESALYG
jgi:hypothetical protein